MGIKSDTIYNLEHECDLLKAEIDRLKAILKVAGLSDTPGKYIQRGTRKTRNRFIPMEYSASCYSIDGNPDDVVIIEIPECLRDTGSLQQFEQAILQEHLMRDMAKVESPLNNVSNSRLRGFTKIMINRVLRDGYDKPVKWQNTTYSLNEFFARAFDGSHIADRFRDALPCDVANIIKNEGLAA